MNESDNKKISTGSDAGDDETLSLNVKTYCTRKIPEVQKLRFPLRHFKSFFY